MSSSPDNAELIAQAAESIGTMGFYDGLLDRFREIVTTDSAQIIFFKSEARPDYVTVYRTPSDIQSLYRTTFSRKCPMQHYWERHRRAAVVRIREAQRPGTDYREYFDVFYRAARLRDEIGVFLPVGETQAVGLFVERDGYFSDDEVDCFRDLLSPLLRLHGTNMRLLIDRQTLLRGLTPGGGEPFAIVDRYGDTVVASKTWRGGPIRTTDLQCSAFDTLGETFPMAPGGYICVGREASVDDDTHTIPALVEATLSIGFTPRERDAFEAILRGQSVSQASAALGISANTLKVHRKRLFAKLGITSERELLLMVVATLRSRDRHLGRSGSIA